MYTRIATLVTLLLALTAVSASAAQIYTAFDSSLNTSTPQVYKLSIDTSTPASEDQNSDSSTVASTVDQETMISNNGVLTKLACGFSLAPGASSGWFVHVVVGGALSGLTCNVSSTTTGRTCTDTVDTVAVFAGTRIALQITPFNGPTALTKGTCVVVFK